MAIKCSKCQTDNPSDSKYSKECATPLPSSDEIPVSHTKTLETPKKELTTGSIFAGKYQIIYFLYRVKFPVLPEIINKGFLYNISEDRETGEVFIRRFRIKNWNETKERI